jgi:sugar phosphate isomerase/epimerase
MQSRDFITFVHLADSNRKCPGFGKFDFADFISLLDEAGYDGFMSIEAFSIPDQDTALKKGIEYVRPLMAKRSERKP